MNRIGDLRKCPRCASNVPTEAWVCAHCRAKLSRPTEGWWKASDGVWYPPQQHPDYNPASLPRPERRPMKRSTKQAIAIVCVLVVLFAGAWFGNVGGIKCNYYRDQLVEAKAARLSGDSYAKRDAVADAARAARSNGCDVDDLIDPSVG